MSVVKQWCSAAIVLTINILHAFNSLEQPAQSLLKWLDFNFLNIETKVLVQSKDHIRGYDIRKN